MAIKLHRAKGFIFNNVVVNNTDNIFLLDVKRNATSIKTRYDFIVPKRNGSKTYNNRYEDNFVDVVIGVYEVDIEARRAKQRTLLQNMINIESKLIFLDEPSLFYYAEVVDVIEVSEGEIFTEITIHFKASYCKYELLDDLNDLIINTMFESVDDLTILVNTLQWTNINALTNKTVVNNGNFEATPIIELTANTNCTSITISNGINGFTLQNLLAGETIYIDTEKMVVYKIASGVKQSIMTRFTGQFITIPTGTNTITINGQSFNINISIDYRNTYIV
ncbi:MAG: distal tail protein Dit [Sedimentibacter sp.]|uniref:distal tail protein Dit n=1 Tax=Sedimentibacter sp. TaxID=1960295 RepID=UPI003159573C